LDVRLRFPLRRPFLVDDHWPLEGNAAEMTFEATGLEVKALVVTFRNQSTEMAPTITQLHQGAIKAEITVKGDLEALGRRIVKRFVDYANLYFSLDVDTDAMEAEYVPVNDEERTRIGLYTIKATRERPLSHLPFNMLAQAFLAGESSDDPSFASRMFSLAREAIIGEQYIDAFRYSFLLFEALHGRGKFRIRELIRALLENNAFKTIIFEAIKAFEHESIPTQSAARTLVKSYPTPETLTAYLVDRRGFYFHGNLSHSNAWHPDRQQEAKPLAEVCIQIAGRVSRYYAQAMFTPEINARFISNAKSHGATMTIQVQVRFIDSQNTQQSRMLEFEVPGTTATSLLAIRINQHFLTWAEAELGSAKLLSAIARDKASGIEIFRSQYLRSDEFK
jgi:hypothetical protein